AAGFNFFIWKSDDAYINQRTMKLNSKKKENDSLKVILEPLVHSKINEIGTGQNNNLSKDALKEIEFPFPNPKEQVKIASCLSSLDDLIAAHSQKLDLLKDHKKGLMRNLFPQEGEKVPKLRFKEFEKDGEWVENQLQEHCHNISSGKDKNQDDGKIDLYGSTGIIGKTENESYEGDYILVARVGANAGLLNRAIGKFGVTDNTLIINLKEPEMVDFIFYSLDKIGLNKLVFGSGQPLVTGKQLKELNIPIPKNPKEQQKIASCLSALDELITSQLEKIDQLQQHKKGMMQGLFPKIED
ncbi:MAG TPA: restriction endonuclease subunit S, partial [Paludibacteraceae bacterium]|nr:restriction endonuclease subunit S [Paludibacteraceae bacterium]